MTELEAISEMGVALDVEECEPGVSALATVTISPIGGMQTMAIIMPPARMPMRQKIGLAIDALRLVNPKINADRAKAYFRNIVHTGTG